MINRSVHMIFEPSGMPVPSEEEVQFEAREMVNRSGWGLPLIDRLRKVQDPYWREAITRCLMSTWDELVRDKDEQTYYYDSDGDIRYCWMDADCDFERIIRRSTNEQVEEEKGSGEPNPGPFLKGRERNRPTPARTQIVNNYYIQTHNAPIITDCNVTIH